MCIVCVRVNTCSNLCFDVDHLCNMLLRSYVSNMVRMANIVNPLVANSTVEKKHLKASGKNPILRYTPEAPPVSIKRELKIFHTTSGLMQQCVVFN